MFRANGNPQEVFDNLQAQNIVTWNTLISRYVEHGNGVEPLKLYERMQLEVVRNVIIFT